MAFPPKYLLLTKPGNRGQEQAAATQEVTAAVMEIAQMAEKLAETAQSI